MAKTRTSSLIFLFLLLATSCSVSSAQAHPSNADDAFLLLTPSACRDSVPPASTFCEVKLPASLDTGKSKVGDHFSIKLNLARSPSVPPISSLDASLMEVQTAERGHGSTLRIRMERALCKDGRELPVEVTIVAIASAGLVRQEWLPPAIIVDRFPPSPSDEERLPGERKYSEDERHTSPLDAIPDTPQSRTMLCTQSLMRDACLDLLEARGIFGYKGVKLANSDSSSPADSVLEAKKNIAIPAGTYLVVELKRLAGGVDVKSKAPSSAGPVDW